MNKLSVKWSKRENDFMIHYPNSCDGSFISQLIKPWKMIHPTSLIDSWKSSGYREIDCYRGALGKYSLIEMDWIKELERRGYDPKTLKFEIKKKDAREEKLSGSKDE